MTPRAVAPASRARRRPRLQRGSGPGPPRQVRRLQSKRAEQALVAAKTAALARHHLTVPQYGALLMLAYLPEASAAQLSRACLVTPQTMATIVENLERNGLVAREPSPMHRRVLRVWLTEPGRTLLHAADRDARAVEERLAASFTPAEADQLRELLGRASDVLAADTVNHSEKS